MENNIKKMYDKEIETFEAHHASLVKNKINNNLKLYKLIGNLVELFLQKQFESYTKLVGGAEPPPAAGKILESENKPKNLYPNL